MNNKFSRIFSVMVVAGVPAYAMAEPPVIVARLAQVDGTVMVNQGTVYKKAASGEVLKQGAKIVTTKGATVALVYKDGCIKQLKESSILTVGPASECTAKQNNERVYLADAVGETATDAPSAGAGSMGGGGALSGNMIALGLGGLVVAGGAVSISNSKDDSNASPE